MENEKKETHFDRMERFIKNHPALVVSGIITTIGLSMAYNVGRKYGIFLRDSQEMYEDFLGQLVDKFTTDDVIEAVLQKVRRFDH